MRTPAEIAAEARGLLETSNTKFVPMPLVQIAELFVEFMASSVVALAELDATREQLAELHQAFADVRAELAALRAASPPTA